MKRQLKLFYQDQRTNILILTACVLLNVFQFTSDELEASVAMANGEASWIIPASFVIAVGLEFFMIKMLFYIVRRLIHKED